MPSQTRLKRALRRGFAEGLTLLILVFGGTVWRVVRTPVQPVVPPLVVNDVSQLNPIRVSEIITPAMTEEIVAAVRDHPGPIAIGGARHSMGGQILELSPVARTITVQAGATWRQIQEAIDPANLSVRIM